MPTFVISSKKENAGQKKRPDVHVYSHAGKEV